jgi:hypothetical protein
MASENWFANLEATIFTIVKFRLERSLKSKYPSLFCTTSGQTDADPVFPTVYIHELPGREIGSDLENATVNAVEETLQVEVTTNTSKTDCKTVMTETMLQFKALRFNVSTLPLFSIEGNTHRGVARFRRVVGRDDSDIVKI